MSPKVLAQSGISLADVYDIEGSIVGVEQLDAADVKVVHELGATIHSERVLTFLLRAPSTDVAQSIAWNIALAAFPDSINRILSIAVIADADRVSNCLVSIVEPSTGNDHIIWAWDAAVDSAIAIREFAASAFLLRPVAQIAGGLPNLLTRTGPRSSMPQVVFRGVSTAFGAGTVEAIALIQVCRPDRGTPTPGEPSSFGLPIPSW